MQIAISLTEIVERRKMDMLDWLLTAIKSIKIIVRNTI